MKTTFGSSPGAALDGLARAISDEVAGFVRDEREIAKLQARQARRLARAVGLAESKAELLQGGLTPKAREWARRSLRAEVACASRRSEGAVSRLIADAETLVSDLPSTLAALEAGEVSYAHARLVVVHAGSLPIEARAGFEHAVLPQAREKNPARFDDAARHLREVHHPESITRRAVLAREERAVWLDAERDGMATLHHHLSAVDALAIHDVIDQAARAARSDAEPRTQAQLRSDILADRILGRADGLAGFVPSVIVTVPAVVLAGCESDPTDSLPSIPADPPAELHGYGPIDPGTARRIAAAAPTFLRVLTHPATGDVIETAGRYRIPTALREVLVVADEHCRFPGCGRRAARCELDHTVDWAHGGRSTASNLAHLCTSHHHLKHEGGWQVARPPDTGPASRTLEWRSPLGATYRTTPPARASCNDPPPF
ncbi:HNH endonuclease [Herbiconiux sp. CPCC 203407]|uniref:HNH endonuclease n=1 Tax=Herbiconiux oxytropis TaxID=2970915 RepID=A0AA42BVX0_9MICO|nr:HNH endonuclease signature motif containing protein [Herbiconiux oxytropis]MCS5722248.1 HNH endonuclease [Herbiconiux oxytropis]MCS5727114.1 HNH endonuclease [Herbiconiux oxytropis]